MVKRTELSNGVRVVTERMEGMRSAAVGVWVNAGSVFETAQNAGVSHFIEHMLFQGTETRSASDIAAETDAVGGELNAFTAKECTCFHARVPDDRPETAVALLADILQHSTLDPVNMEKEKRVVIEEIAELSDSPEDLAFDGAGAALFSDTPLESEILGTAETVGALSRKDLCAYMQRHYTAENTVIAAAGSFDEEKMLSLLEDAFSGMRHGERQPLPEIRIRDGLRVRMIEKDAEQINLCIALPGPALGTDAYEALAVLSNILGGSMSSRLFQRIREEKGLSYSVGSYPTAYRGAGCLNLYAGTNETQAEELVACMLRELDDLKANGVTETEFRRAKQQLQGSYLLGMESVPAHMDALGKCELLLGQKYDFDAVRNRIECVTIEAVNEAAARWFTPEATAFCAVGRLQAVGGALRRTVEQWWTRNAAHMGQGERWNGN